MLAKRIYQLTLRKMDTKKLLLGTLVGGVAFFLLGGLLYGYLLMDFFQNNAGSAIGVYKEEPEFVTLILGNLATSFFFTYIFLRFGNVGSFGDGLKAGAIIGFLNALGFNLIMFSTANISTIASGVVDVAVFTTMGAIAGGIIGMLIADKGESQVEVNPIQTKSTEEHTEESEEVSTK